MCGDTMTGNAFLKRLRIQLDFLSPEDQEVVLDFYQKKLMQADTFTEEEAIVKSFGSPEHIAQKLKETFIQHLAAQKEAKDEHSEECIGCEPTPCDESEESEQSEESPSEKEYPISSDISISEESSCEPTPSPAATVEKCDLTEDTFSPDPVDVSEDESAVENGEPSLENQEEDVIFSKGVTEEKAPEVIHSLENNEIKTLYGEKVVIEERTEPIEEFTLDPLDRENGLTQEEIENAKAETLEKAKHFQNETTAIEEELEVDPMPKEEAFEAVEELDAKPEDENALKKELPTERTIGIFERMFSGSNTSSGTVTFVTVLLSLILSPVLLLIFGLILAAYAIVTLAILLLSALLLALVVALIIAGVIELVYGFAALLDTVSVALIEIGLGTVLFSLVTAIAGLIYEFIFGVLPKTLVRLTRLCKKSLKAIKNYLYGGKA